MNIADLHIEKEILPIFDYTLNKYSRAKVLDILNNPLPNIGQVKLRQCIFKGFEENRGVLQGYSYSVSYLMEVHDFLVNFELEDLSQLKLKFNFVLSKKKKDFCRGKITQMVLLFHRLNSYYFSRLSLKAFPPEYAKTLKGMIDFLSGFNLGHYDSLIREYKFKDTDLIKFWQKIFDAKSNGLVSLFWDGFFYFEACLSIS